MIKTLKEILERDLNKLKKEIDLYEDEERMWLVKAEINNSAGHLTMHLCGNLKHFIGAVLGNSGFKRDRESEFTGRNLSRRRLHELIDETKDVVLDTLDNLNELELEDTYPINVLRENMSTEFFLTHLATHLSYHLGQLSYHRRMTAQ